MRLLPLLLVACSSPPHPAPAGPAGPRPADPTPGGAAPAAPPAPASEVKPDAPAVDAALAGKATGFIDAFVNQSPTFTRDGKRVVFISNRDGLPQLYVSGKPDEPPLRIVTTKERVQEPIAAPGGKDVVFMSDTGADERWSLFRVGLDGKNLVELTPGAKLNRDGFIIPDGKPSTLYFTARQLSEAKSTLYAASAIAASEARPIYTDDKPMSLQDVSPDGATAAAIEYRSGSENYVVRIDTASGKAEKLFPTTGKASIFSVRIARDGKRLLVATDGGAEQCLVLALDMKTGKQLAKYAVTPATAAVDTMAVAKEGNLLAVSLLVGNHSEIRLLDARSLAPRARIELPLGRGVARWFSEDGKRLAVEWSTPRAPTDIFAIDTQSGKLAPLRKDPRPTLAGIPAIEPTTVDIPAFDGGRIPTNVYVPGGEQAKKHPVLVVYHGGPAATSVIRWNPITAFFVALGYVVVEPNVRGSAGFGSAFEEADNGPKRLDAFKDIETSARWVAAQPWADPDRLVVFGASYGGYTTFVALSRWPELWRAGVDLFGVVNLQTLMATTTGVMRDLFLLEFGDPEKDAAFLRSISPSTDIAKIVDPTFVYAGANDPRVRRSESDAIVEVLRARKVPTEYMVADNEGHSLARRETQIAFLARCAKFLEAALR